jgi:polysaccharide deacetylase family protein (PEP-CTERM system associated)
MTPILSFDVEEWLHGVPHLRAAAEASTQSTVEEEFDLVAEPLAHAGCSATFFVLAEVARAHPRIVRRIVEAGWEVASHGSGHRSVAGSDRRQFRESLRRSVAEIEDLSGAKVRGYRAPMWTVDATTEWAIEEMLEAGLEYDSSVFPEGRHDARSPFWLGSAHAWMLEVPPAPLWVGPLWWPLAGGLSQRLLPVGLYRALLCREARRTGYVHMYFHPWEFTTRAWGLEGLGPMMRAFFTIGRRAATEKLAWLLREFRPSSIGSAIEGLRACAAPRRRLREIDRRLDGLVRLIRRHGNGPEP